MKKTLTYGSFSVACIIVVLLFVTSKTYPQLAIAVILYPLVVYFALKVFPRKNTIKEEIEIPKPTESITSATTLETPKVENGRVEIADVDKRAFLKMIGAAGISFFLFSLLSKRAEVPFFGKFIGPSTTTLTNVEGTKINPAESQPTDGYRISEVDDNVITFYGFTNQNGAWFIMKEDTDSGSFRYSKGNSEFADNWTKREQLKYDYYHNVF